MAEMKLDDILSALSSSKQVTGASKPRILVCAPSNAGLLLLLLSVVLSLSFIGEFVFCVAVDEIIARLMETGLMDGNRSLIC